MAELIQYANGVPGIKWPVDKLVLQIGRSVDINDIWLDDSFVSKKHARIIVKRKPGSDDELEYFVQDMQSTNHTYVNQESVDESVLRHNDVLMIGKNKLVFVSEGVEEYVTINDYKDDKTVQMESNFIEAEIEESVQDVTFVSSSDMSAKHRFSRRLTIY